MTKLWANGHLKSDSPFTAIFAPDGIVPLKSIVPMIPREEGCPKCYELDAEKLTEPQLQQLAELLYQRWQPECESIEMAVNYIREPGLPLECKWFDGVSTDLRAFL